jgi:quercetin dioxygenase-like cupin family protein
MVVINETLGDPDNTTPSTGFAGEPELTNNWFRSYRVRLEPGASMAAHRHENPVVILQATAGTGRADGPMDWEFNEPGQWAFYDAGAEHGIVNQGDGAIELLEVEVRLAR